MPKFRVTQDHETCIGCGACVAVCPENWKMGDDGKAMLRKAVVDKIGCNQEAADGCPVGCIGIEEI
jgi:ferredoxin